MSQRFIRFIYLGATYLITTKLVHGQQSVDVTKVVRRGNAKARFNPLAVYEAFERFEERLVTCQQRRQVHSVRIRNHARKRKALARQSIS